MLTFDFAGKTAGALTNLAERCGRTPCEIIAVALACYDSLLRHPEGGAAVKIKRIADFSTELWMEREG